MAVFSAFRRFSRVLSLLRGDEHACRGAVLPTLGLLAVVLIVTGTAAIEMGRMYLVMTRAQRALDGALLGAVASASSMTQADLELEARNLFSANYPEGYMDTKGQGERIVFNINGSDYRAEATFDVPMLLVSVVGFDQFPVTVRSRVARKIQESGDIVELTLGLDNTGSMAFEGKIEGLKSAASLLVDILYDNGREDHLENLTISVVPFDRHVNLGVTETRREWLKPEVRTRYNGTFTERDNYFFLEGEPNVRYDFDGNPPESDVYRFFDSFGNIPGNLQQVLFASDNRQQTLAMINAMQPAGDTRTNIGMLWSFYSLHHLWQGWWDGRNELPRTPGAVGSKRVLKYLVFLSDGLNTVMRGGSDCFRSSPATCRFVTNTTRSEIPCEFMQNWCDFSDGVPINCRQVPGHRTPEADGKCYSYHNNNVCQVNDPPGCTCTSTCLQRRFYRNDDEDFQRACQAAKDYGITLITIGLGNSVNHTALRSCASKPEYYFPSPTADQLEEIFKGITDIILSNAAVTLAE